VRFVVMALSSVSIRQHLHSSGNSSGVREWHHSATRSIQCHAGPILHVLSLQACLQSGAQSAVMPDVQFEIQLRTLLMYSWGVVGAVHIFRACSSIEAIRPNLDLITPPVRAKPVAATVHSLLDPTYLVLNI